MMIRNFFTSLNWSCIGASWAGMGYAGLFMRDLTANEFWVFFIIGLLIWFFVDNKSHDNKSYDERA